MIVLDRLVNHVGDTLFDWTLLLPRDLTLLLLAVLLVAVLSGLRWLVADRSALRLLVADENRLSELRAAARAAGDRKALQQHQHLRRLLAARRARLEFLPALTALLPALLVLDWGTRRLEYLPLTTHREFRLEATFPASAIGRPAHLVPQAPLSVEKTWIQIIETSAETPIQGTTRWQVTVASPAVKEITLRHPGGSVEVPIEVGTRTYAMPVVEHAGEVVTDVVLLEYRPLGIVPPLRRLGLPAWMVGLLLLTVPGYLAARRMFHIA